MCIICIHTVADTTDELRNSSVSFPGAKAKRKMELFPSLNSPKIKALLQQCHLLGTSVSQLILPVIKKWKMSKVS